MAGVFRGHFVVCGWNRRGARVVHALKAVGDRPIIIVHDKMSEVISEVGAVPGVFVMSGDASDATVLIKADVPSAKSVVVLAIDALGASADARSVQIALAVERIEASVYTVVELLDIQNKGHFSWTKVDDLVTDQGIAVRMMAQGIRHACHDLYREGDGKNPLLHTYRQIIDPGHLKSNLSRLDLEWSAARDLSFGRILAAGLRCGVLPVALVGYRLHETTTQEQQVTSARSWSTWKTDVRSNPPADTKAADLWTRWPGDDAPLGVLILGRKKPSSAELLQALAR